MKIDVETALRGILSSIVSMIIVNSIVIFSILVLAHYFWSQMTVILPIIISVPTSIIFIKTDLKRSIIAGIGSGLLIGIYFYSYCCFFETPSTDWGWRMLDVISIIITLVWIFSCTVGAVSSYYIRDRYRKNKECCERG